MKLYDFVPILRAEQLSRQSRLATDVAVAVANAPFAYAHRVQKLTEGLEHESPCVARN